MMTRDDFVGGLRKLLDDHDVKGHQTTFWWRDDDAIEPTNALDRLIEITSPLPLALAVIPAPLKAGLMPAIAATRDNVMILQHGISHTNHEPTGKKMELGPARSNDIVLGELSEGLQRLQKQFGDRFLPALVPPWNRIADDIVHRLPRVGLRAYSTYDRRRSEGFCQINTHVDPIAWRDGGGFVGWAKALQQFDYALGVSRQTGEPIGILTHHLAHDDPLWAYCEAITEALQHPAILWPRLEDLFPV